MRSTASRCAHGRRWVNRNRPRLINSLVLRDLGWNTRREIIKVDDAGLLRLELKLSPWAIALIREIA